MSSILCSATPAAPHLSDHNGELPQSLDVRERVVFPAAQEPLDRWVLDLLVTEAGERPGVPSVVHHLLADHRLGSHMTGPQGPDYYQVLAVA